MFSSTNLSLNNDEWISLLGVIVPFMPHGVNAKIDYYDDRTGRGVVTTLATKAPLARDLELGLAGVLGHSCPGRLATPLCICATCARRREALRTHPVMVQRALTSASPVLYEVNGVARIGSMAEMRDLLDAS
jgi:hypothetical protein